MAHERKKLSDQDKEISQLIANIFPNLIKAITRYCINNPRSQELRTFDQSVTLQELLPDNSDLQTLLGNTAFKEGLRLKPTYGDFTDLIAAHISNLIALNDQYKHIYIALNQTAQKYRDIITPINIANWSAHYVGTTLELIKASLNDAEIQAEMNSKGLPYEILIAPLISIFNLTTSAKLQRGSHQAPAALMAAAGQSRQTSTSTSQASNGRESSSLGRESMLDLLVENFGRSAHSLAEERTSLLEASAATLSTPSGPNEIERMMIRMNTGRYTARVQRSDYMQNIFMPYTHSSSEQINLAQSQRSIYEGISLFCFNPCSVEEKKTQDNLAPEQDMWDEQAEKPPREIWGDSAQLEEILRQLNDAATAFDDDKNLSTLIKTTIEQLWNIGEWKTLLVEKKGELLDLPLVKGAIARLLKAITSHQNTPLILQVLQPAIVEVLYGYFEQINTHTGLIEGDLKTAIKQVISLPALQGAIESKEADAEMDGGEALASTATTFLGLVKSSDATVQEVQEWHQASAPLFQKDHEPQLLLRPPVMEEKFPRDEVQLRQHVRAHFALQLANLHDISGIDFEEQVSEILIEQQYLESITLVLLKNHEALSEILKDNQDIEGEVREFLNAVVSTDARNSDPQHVFQVLSDKPQYHLAIIQIISNHWPQLTPPHEIETSMPKDGSNYEALHLLNISKNYGDGDLPDITAGDQESLKLVAMMLFKNRPKAEGIITKHKERIDKVVQELGKFEAPLRLSEGERAGATAKLNEAIKLFEKNINAYRENPEKFIEEKILQALKQEYLFIQPQTDTKVKIYELLRQFLPIALRAITTNEEIALPAVDIHAISQQLQRQLALTILFAHKQYFLDHAHTDPALKTALGNSEGAAYEFLIQDDGAAASIIDHYRDNKAVMAKEDKTTIDELLSRECATHQETNNYTALAGSFARWQVLAYDNEEQAKEVAKEKNVTLHPPFIIAENFPVLVTNCPDLLNFPGDKDQEVLREWVGEKIAAFQKLFDEFLEHDEYKAFIRTKALNENISFDQAHKDVCTNYLNGVFSQLSTVTDIRSNLKSTLIESAINGLAEISEKEVINDDGVVLDLGDGTNGDKSYYKPIAALYIYPEFFTPEVYQELGTSPEDKTRIKTEIAKPPKQAFEGLMAYLKNKKALSQKISVKISEDYELTYPCYNQARGAAFLKFFFHAASSSLTSGKYVTRLLDAGGVGELIRPVALSFDHIKKLLADLDNGQPLDLTILKLLKNIFEETIDTILNLASNEELTRILEPFPGQNPLQFVSALFVSLMPGFITQAYELGSREYSLATLLANFFENFNKKYIGGQIPSNQSTGEFIKSSPALSEYKRYISEKLDQLILHAEKHSGRLTRGALSEDQLDFLDGLDRAQSFTNKEDSSHGGFFENLLIFSLNRERVEPVRTVRTEREVNISRRDANEEMAGASKISTVNGYLDYCKNLLPRSIYNIISKNLFGIADEYGQIIHGDSDQHLGPEEVFKPMLDTNEIENLFHHGGGPLSLNKNIDYYSARIYLEYVLVPRLEASQDNNHCAALAADIKHLLAQPNAENDTKSFIKRANKFIGRAYQQNVLGPAPDYINELYLEQQIQSAKDRSQLSSSSANRSQESNGSTTSSSTGSQTSSDRGQTRDTADRSPNSTSRHNSVSTDSANSASKTQSDIGKSIISLVEGEITLPPAITYALNSNDYQQAGIEAQAYLDKNVFAMLANKKQLRLLAAIATFKDCFPGRNPQPVFAQFLTTTNLWPRFLKVQDDEVSQFRLPPGAICNAWLYKESKKQLESYQVEGSTITFQQHCVNAIEAIIDADALTAGGQELAWFLEGVTAPDELNQIAENQDPRNIINDHISYALNQFNASPQGPKLNYDQTIKIIELIGTTLSRKYLLDEKQQKRAINYYKKPQNLLALANTNVGPNALPNYFKHDYIDYRILGKFINPEVRQKTPPISTKINLDNFLTKYPGFENINTELTDKANYFLPILQRLLSHSYFNEHGNEKTKFIKHYFESLKVFPQTERDFKCNFMLDILSSYFSAKVETLQTMGAVPDQQEIAMTILRTDEPQGIQQHFKDHWLTIKDNRPTNETIEQLKPGIGDKLSPSHEDIKGVLQNEGKRGLLKAFWKEFITPEIAKEFIGKNVYVITDYLIESFKHYCASHIETLSAEQQKIFIENFSEIFYYIANSATQSELTTRQVGCRYKSYKNASSADTEETSRDYNNAIIELDFAKDATKPVPVDAKTFANIVAIAIAKVIERNLDLTKGNVQRALPISKFKLSADASKEDYFQELNQQVATCFKIYTTRYPAKNKPEEHNKGLLKDIGLTLFEQSQPGKKPAAAQVESDPSSEAVTTDHAYHMPADAAMLSSEKTVTAIQHSLQNNGWSDTALNAYMKALSPATSANAVANDQAELVREAEPSDDKFEEAAKRLKGYIEANCLAKMKGGISLYGRPAATGMRQIIKALENTALTKEQITTLTQAFAAARLTITPGCLSGPRTKETKNVYKKLSEAKTPQEFINAVNGLVPKPPTPSTDAAVVPNQG